MKSISLFSRLPTTLLAFRSQFKYSSDLKTNQQGPFDELERTFLDPKDLYNLLTDKGINFYTGVPDSLLKDFCAYVTDNTEPQNHIVTANEGNALALASGYHFATNKIPLVYLQNSGIGNIINPVMSLAHQKVYGVPMIVLVGWRGEPGKKDEPQHIIQGKTMAEIVTACDMQFDVMPDFIEGAEEVIDSAIYSARKKNQPYFIFVKRQCFSNYKIKTQVKNEFKLNREQALDIIVPIIGKHDVVVGCTGFLSRELYELRDQYKQKHNKDFYTVGSMGHALSIATGIANVKKTRTVWCMDGDGGAIMHMGSMTTIGQLKPANLKHVIFNNLCHDSVGAQPTAAADIDFCMIAKGCGYEETIRVETEEEIKAGIEKIKNIEGPCLLEVMIKQGARKDLGRPKTSTKQNKEDFMEFLNM